MQKQTSARTVAVLGLLTALGVICSLTFPYGLTVRIGDFIKLSPAFLVIAVAGRLYGFKGSGLVALLTDLIQGFMFSSVSVLIAAVSTLVGITFGIILKNGCGLKRIILAVLLTQIVGSLILTTSVLVFRYGMPFFPTVWFRIIQTVILIAVEIPVLHLLMNVFKLPEKLTKTK